MIVLVVLLAGLCTDTTPPSDLAEAATILRMVMIDAAPEDLGIFFAEIGLEASPDEVLLWTDSDFCDLILDFTGTASDSQSSDSLNFLLETLPVHLLEK